MLAGLVLTSGAAISLTWLGPASGYGWFGARLAILGIGLALALPTVVALLINHVPAGWVGVASGLVTMSRQFGGALGLAVLASVGSRVAGATFERRTELASLRGLVAGGHIGDIRRLAGARTAAIASQAFLHGFTVAIWIATAAVGAALLIALALARTRGGLAVAGGSGMAACGLADAESALRMPTGGTSLSQYPGPVPRQVRGARPPGPPSAVGGDRAGSGTGSTSATGGPARGRPVRKGDVS